MNEALREIARQNSLKFYQQAAVIEKAKSARLRDALKKISDEAMLAGNMNWGESLQRIEEIAQEALKELR